MPEECLEPACNRRRQAALATKVGELRKCMAVLCIARGGGGEDCTEKGEGDEAGEATDEEERAGDVLLDPPSGGGHRGVDAGDMREGREACGEIDLEGWGGGGRRIDGSLREQATLGQPTLGT